MGIPRERGAGKRRWQRPGQSASIHRFIRKSGDVMKTYRILAATVAAGLTLGLNACGDSKNPVGSDADDELASESLTEDDGSGAPSPDREGGGADGDLSTPGGGLPVTDQPVRDEPGTDEFLSAARAVAAV